MINENILALLDKAIEAGKRGSYELGDVFDDLDSVLETDGKQAVLRYYFDCWADAVNHDYMVYKIKDPNEWIEAAIELRDWFLISDATLNERELWKEALPPNF